MFSKILIANRGEIACRIIATCRRLGIHTIAVYSEADAGARHVRLADAATCIGPAPASASYLKVERILAAAREHGAEAIHPGYGFLSENPDFARAVEAAGIALIGPSAQSMEIMGSKAAAKDRMAPAGVPLIPGYHGDDQNDEHLQAEAERVGFPLMLKAAAGGGGKGMRVVRSAGEFGEALAAARREARSAFGDERMILERYLARPRHIEAQVFADAHGNTVHLYERDCSSQRRHQKIIEEAPAPNLDPALRTELLAAAVRAAQAVNYLGAGTVEFLVDGDDFYFLEMNTRLQVEHPVTEMITGLDLVEWQIRVAAGEKLPRQQDQISIQGHAMEARIYAEDPDRGFVPSSGWIRALNLPEGEQIRIDRGVDTGDTVSVHYDPMIAKLIVHGPDREACRARLKRALSASFIAGPTTNLGFLQALAATEAFASGRLDAGLLDREPALVQTHREPPVEVVAAAAAYWLRAQEPDAPSPSPWARCDGWRPGTPASRWLDIECGELRTSIEATGFAGDYKLMLADQDLALRLDPLGVSRFRLDLGDRNRPVWLHADGESRLDVCLDELRWTLTRHARFEAAQSSAGGDGRILAPMPGRILEIRVTEGAQVAEGEPVLVMEAMKMELTIKAPIDGTVEGLAVERGDLVEADALLLSLIEADPEN
ncbi:acetyl/propionyl/methylcrotonyl-CoA carboxylase subunit alpha [Wenzhouxiangella limi]|uniref:Biotin carboxylase n=1 Tax=Wenzhouxiangella limi TaxID=2707351 RepID=A0A845V201_9GAMM|nr:acetyl-CoA carboxylase biotin carboxylase subunit [Wenzhouxiangella limi]NDY96622.1 acetyl-CoA carboxylase biotin carboxylase subunit [Wenzhouxiangella limi]